MLIIVAIPSPPHPNSCCSSGLGRWADMSIHNSVANQQVIDLWPLMWIAAFLVIAEERLKIVVNLVTLTKNYLHFNHNVFLETITQYNYMSYMR